MNVVSKAKKSQVIRCLVEGNSIRSTARITGVSFNSVQKITRQVGQAALDYSDAAISNLKCTKIQCDEIWNFCYAKDKNVPDDMIFNPGVGSLWTWTAMCADTKLLVSWVLGPRDADSAWKLMSDVKERVANRIQLTTDGYQNYLEAVHNHFGNDIDYAMLVKTYSSPSKKEQQRYSPAKCLGAKRMVIKGSPDRDEISTSYMERQNLNFRMTNRRYTRLTNAFSKKAEMQAFSFALTAFYHNFIRKHLTLKTTPAVAAGIADHEWTVDELVDLLPEIKYNTRPQKAG